MVGLTEGYKTGSFISELAMRIQEELFDWLDAPIVRVCAADVPVPMSDPLEDAAIPERGAHHRRHSAGAGVGGRMATEVILPMLGETMNEGTIVAWSKKEGDAVKPGDVLFSVESDKATLEVEATTGGYLRRILAPAGSTVAVLSVVAYITATLDEVVSAPAGQVAAAPRPAAAAPSKTSDGAPRRTARPSSPAPLPAGRPSPARAPAARHASAGWT